MERIRRQYILGVVWKRHIYLIFFILAFQRCVPFSTGAIATTKFSTTVETNQKETLSHPDEIMNNDKVNVGCPESCVCNQNKEDKDTGLIICRRAELKLFPTISRDETVFSSSRLFERL